MTAYLIPPSFVFVQSFLSGINTKKRSFKSAAAISVAIKRKTVAAIIARASPPSGVGQVGEERGFKTMRVCLRGQHVDPRNHGGIRVALPER
jgi:hypothetical protein